MDIKDGLNRQEVEGLARMPAMELQRLLQQLDNEQQLIRFKTELRGEVSKYQNASRRLKRQLNGRRVGTDEKVRGQALLETLQKILMGLEKAEVTAQSCKLFPLQYDASDGRDVSITNPPLNGQTITVKLSTPRVNLFGESTTDAANQKITFQLPSGVLASLVSYDAATGKQVFKFEDRAGQHCFVEIDGRGKLVWNGGLTARDQIERWPDDLLKDCYLPNDKKSFFNHLNPEPVAPPASTVGAGNDDSAVPPIRDDELPPPSAAGPQGPAAVEQNALPSFNAKQEFNRFVTKAAKDADKYDSWSATDEDEWVYFIQAMRTELFDDNGNFKENLFQDGIMNFLDDIDEEGRDNLEDTDYDNLISALVVFINRQAYQPEFKEAFFRAIANDAILWFAEDGGETGRHEEEAIRILEAYAG